MKNFMSLSILLIGIFNFGQCTFGTSSAMTENGANISTGGNYEYSGATDFDVPFGKVFTVETFEFNLLKGAADLQYVNLEFIEEFAGLPSTTIHSFDQMVPVSQEFVYATEIDNLDVYKVVVEIPQTFELERGKYFIGLTAAAGDEHGAWWEIAAEDASTVGRFDFSKFENENWFGGYSYYDYVFAVSGTCADSGDEQPELGEACGQGNPIHDHEIIFDLRTGSLADDFIVAENTQFSLETLRIATLQLGNIINATLQIRNSNNDLPGEIIYSVPLKGPKTENFYGYWPVDDFPLDAASVVLDFEFDEPIELAAGKYFIEIRDVMAFPFTDILGWEGTSEAGIGGFAYESMNNGQSWTQIEGYNLVFDVEGYCQDLLGTGDLEMEEFAFFPNPVRNELNISSKSDLRNISVYNLSGQLVLNSKSTSKKLDTSSLSAGIYLVKVELKNGQTETFKIVKR